MKGADDYSAPFLFALVDCGKNNSQGRVRTNLIPQPKCLKKSFRFTSDEIEAIIKANKKLTEIFIIPITAKPKVALT